MFIKLRLMTIAILFHATSTWALPMDYAFDIDWSDGSLSGTSDTVYVTLDELAGTGTEIFTPPPTSAPATGALTAFRATINGFEFYLNDTAYMEFVDGALTYVSYLSDNDSVTQILLIDVFDAFFSSGTPNAGTISPESFREEGDASVPEPATFALFGLGLAGLGWSRRKKA